MKISKIDLFMLLCNDKIIFSDIEGHQCEMTVSGVNKVPNVPIYDYLYEPGVEINYSGELEIKSHFRKRTVYVLLPDDANFMEKKAIGEYCSMKLQAKAVTEINQCDLLNPENYSGIAVSRTDRCISVVCSLRVKKIKNIVYIDKNSGVEDIKKAISDSIGDNRFDDIEVCINNCNDDMNDFKEFGELVDYGIMMDNAKKIVERLNLK